MEIGIVLSPIGNWKTVIRAAKLADELGFNSVGFWDHYHAEQPDWSMVTGWAAYGALALATERIHLLPMVICRPNYIPGVLAKETSMLAIISQGRFELGIGAGDYEIEFEAWHYPFPDRSSRIEALGETVAIMRKLWQGELVTYHGKHIQLTNAGCTPAPIKSPRVVVGVGSSKTLAKKAVQYADELNIYNDEEIYGYSKEIIASSGREVQISVYIHTQTWPDDLSYQLETWAKRGVSRAMINIGFGEDPVKRIPELPKVI